MKRIAVFPGTFDPFTLGHQDIVEKGLKLFDHIVVAIGHNALKKTMFPLDQRLNWLNKIFENNPKVSVSYYEGLTIKYCQEIEARFILRGLRTVGDFEYEKQIAMVNADQNDSVQSVFILSEQRFTAVSSTVIRDLIRHGGEYKKYLPNAIEL